MGILATSAGQILGIGLNAIGQEQQMNNQQHLMDVQQQHQMELNKQGQKIQQENWDYTNYENQRKHMEKAGLNVGLMYGTSGSGGSTMGSSSGGSAGSGSAPQNNTPQVMGMGIQGAMAESQIELQKAQARNLDADTNIKANSTPENVGADTRVKTEQANKVAEEVVTAKLENAFRSNNLETALAQAKQTLQNSKVENNKMLAEIGRMSVENTLTKAQTTKESQLTEESKQHVLQEWQKVSQGWENLDNQARHNVIETFKAELKAEYPTISEGLGKSLNEVLKMWENLVGNPTHANTVKK